MRTIGLTFEDAKPGGEKPLAKMNRAELLALAAEKGISVPNDAKKEDVLKLIEASEKPKE